MEMEQIMACLLAYIVFSGQKLLSFPRLLSSHYFLYFSFQAVTSADVTSQFRFFSL
jgi:hypothetical protein